MALDRKDEGATLFKPAIEVGLTKEGESFAAGASTAERPGASSPAVPPR